MLNDDRESVAIKNCGVVGAGTQDVVEIYARESEGLPRGSLVIYGMVLNDFGLELTEPIKGLNFIDFNNGGYSFSSLRQRSAFINFIVHSIEERRLHQVTVQAYVQSFDDESANNGFGLIDELDHSVLGKDGTLLVVVFPLLYDFDRYFFKSIHEEIESFCVSRSILHLDLLPAFSLHEAEELWANPTDHHPNETAHQIAAEEIYGLIESELLDFPRRRGLTGPE